MEVTEARKKLDSLTLRLHGEFAAFEEATGLKIRRVTVDRFEVTNISSVSREDQFAGLRIEATI